MYKIVYHLRFAQTHGNVGWSQKGSQRLLQKRSQRRSAVENDLNNGAGSIADEKATEMKDIAHHAQDAIVGEFGSSEPSTRPDNNVVSQCPQQHDHLLSGKAFLGAFGDAQPLFVA